MSDDYSLEFEHETFGEFTYDDGTRWLEGQMNWLSQQVKLWIYWIEAENHLQEKLHTIKKLREQHPDVRLLFLMVNSL